MHKDLLSIFFHVDIKKIRRKCIEINHQMEKL